MRTQSDLARQCGTTQATIAKIEGDQRTPRWPLLKLLADALDLDSKILLDAVARAEGFIEP